jgi:hypothetical protein
LGRSDGGEAQKPMRERVIHSSNPSDHEGATGHRDLRSSGYLASDLSGPAFTKDLPASN